MEPQHDCVADAGLADQGELLLKRGDRLRAVGRVEDAARMGLERDQHGFVLHLGRRAYGVADHVEMTEMHSVEAADGKGHTSDRTCRKPEMNLQLNTFSGTKVRRSGSVCPRATSLPCASWARTSPGAGSGSTRTERPCRTCASCSTFNLTGSMSGSMTSAGSSRSLTASGETRSSMSTARSIVSGP